MTSGLKELMNTRTPTGDTLFSPDASTSGLELVFERAHIPRFFPLLQCGVELKTRVNVSLRSFLCGHFQVDSDFLDLHVKTVFLDSKPVDDIDAAIVRDGSVIALSAAMPGLVGATMRRGGPLACFRGAITHGIEQATETAQDGHVTLKLFNLLIGRFGPRLLERGVWVKADDLQDFLKKQPDDFWNVCKGARLEGKEVPTDLIPRLDWPEAAGRVQLKVVGSTRLSDSDEGSMSLGGRLPKAQRSI